MTFTGKKFLLWSMAFLLVMACAPAMVTPVPPLDPNAIGTAIIRPRNQLVGSPGTIVPLISTAEADDVEFSTDVPAEYVSATAPYTMEEAATALSCFAGLAGAAPV